MRLNFNFSDFVQLNSTSILVAALCSGDAFHQQEGKVIWLEKRLSKKKEKEKQKRKYYRCSKGL